MKPFVDFLKEQASKDPQHERDRARCEWVSSVERLIAQAQEWLEEADRHTKVLRLVVDENHSIEEDELGTYNAPGLQIWIGEKVVEVRPIARNVPDGIDQGRYLIPAQGLVEISNGARKVRVYRIIKEREQDRWIIVDPDRNVVSELDRSTFEAAIQNLLE